MTEQSETTALLTDQNRPSYVFESRIYRHRKLRAQHFQFCFCSFLLCMAVIAVVVGVSYTLNKNDSTNNSTNLNDTFVLLSNLWPLPDKKSNTIICTDENRWTYALKAGEDALQIRDDIEKITPPLKTDEPSYRHQKVFMATNTTNLLARVGYLQEYATKYIESSGYKTSVCNHTYNFDLKFCNDDNRSDCISKFRTYDGSCNNLKKPNSFGVALTPFRRSLPASYEDGMNEPKTLPSARKISLKVHRPLYRNDFNFTVMLAVWGQFIDHDITATAPSRGVNGETISCCSATQEKHPECFPVYLDPDDPLRKNNITCMEFVRSAPSPDCHLGPRNQMNQVSSFLDASMIYGPDDETVKKIRSHVNGFLKMYVTEDGRSLLPFSEDKRDGCNREKEMKKGRYCFMTGDSRANENLLLTSMHLIWARQHNLIAKRLLEINKEWDDERIFQESRRILIAQIQHITYNEFLPIILGRTFVEKFELLSKKRGYYKRYDENLNPSIANNFATAAFRFAHTLIPGLMKRLSKSNSTAEYVQLHKMLFDPFVLFRPRGLDSTIRGALDTNVEASDPYFTEELKQRLFQKDSNETKQCGLDLVSLNIQRGRDHGLPSYCNWREYCGLKRPRDFDELAGDMDDDSLSNIRAVYGNVDDVDLYTGGLSEKPLKEGILGPTLTCLILDQFVRLKKGDRFWYETDEKPQSFTNEQLEEIRKTSLAKIICENSDDLERVQPYVMRSPKDSNGYESCNKTQRLQLTAWKDDGLPRIPISDNTIFVKHINVTAKHN